jgi:hypothetical protein
MESWHVMHLARAKAGPFRADAEAFVSTGGNVGVRVDLYDEGNNSVRVTSASAQLRVVG